jgi:CheY-like chemotaxis protein
MLTSVTQRGDAALAAANGFSAYLAKPVKNAQLQRCLAMVLGQADHAAGNGQLLTRHTLVEQAVRGHILVVEDNAVNQKVVLHMLTKLGHRAEAVGNGLEALHALETIPYDLVLMDCQMPEMDGFEAVGRLRDSSRRAVPWSTAASVPVVALTASALSGDAARCLQAGFSDYLAKPFMQQQLVQVLTRWTQATGARLAADATVLALQDQAAKNRAEADASFYTRQFAQWKGIEDVKLERKKVGVQIEKNRIDAFDANTRRTAVEQAGRGDGVGRGFAFAFAFAFGLGLGAFVAFGFFGAPP